ncbi:MAG: hypothetical protein QW424_05350 [Candidatus Bathyarchaeia archaeon]
MRIYLEAIEKTQGEEAAESDFIRIDVTDKDFETALRDLKSILNPNKQYIIRKHCCRHDEGGSCTVEAIEE